MVTLVTMTKMVQWNNYLLQLVQYIQAIIGWNVTCKLERKRQILRIITWFNGNWRIGCFLSFIWIMNLHKVCGFTFCAVPMKSIDVVKYRSWGTKEYKGARYAQLKKRGWFLTPLNQTILLILNSMSIIAKKNVIYLGLCRKEKSKTACTGGKLK